MLKKLKCLIDTWTMWLCLCTPFILLSKKIFFSSLNEDSTDSFILCCLCCIIHSLNPWLQLYCMWLLVFVVTYANRLLSQSDIYVWCWHCWIKLTTLYRKQISPILSCAASNEWHQAASTTTHTSTHIRPAILQTWYILLFMKQMSISRAHHNPFSQ